MISKRIKEIAKYSLGFSRIADIGCDHGYLIIEAFQNYHISFAQAIDNKELPLLSAVENIKKHSFFNDVDFTLSNGLDKLENVEAIFICGMGGILIKDILNDNINKISDQTLILEPNRSSYELRKYLMDNSFKIIDERIIHDNFYYEVIIARKSNEKVEYTLPELLYGPINIKKREKEFLDKINNELNRLRKIDSQNTDKLIKIDILRRIINDC